jgi:hypothetical protein
VSVVAAKNNEGAEVSSGRSNKKNAREVCGEPGHDED